MKNNCLDADSISAYAEALAILAVARNEMTWETGAERWDRSYYMLLHASLHLRRKQKGFWLITELRRGQDDE